MAARCSTWPCLCCFGREWWATPLGHCFLFFHIPIDGGVDIVRVVLNTISRAGGGSSAGACWWWIRPLKFHEGRDAEELEDGRPKTRLCSLHATKLVKFKLNTWKSKTWKIDWVNNFWSGVYLIHVSFHDPISHYLNCQWCWTNTCKLIIVLLRESLQLLRGWGAGRESYPWRQPDHLKYGGLGPKYWCFLTYLAEPWKIL